MCVSSCSSLINLTSCNRAPSALSGGPKTQIRPCHSSSEFFRDFPGGPVSDSTSNAGDPGLIPSQGARSQCPTKKTLNAATKTWHSQQNKSFCKESVSKSKKCFQWFSTAFQITFIGPGGAWIWPSLACPLPLHLGELPAGSTGRPGLPTGSHISVATHPAFSACCAASWPEVTTSSLHGSLHFGSAQAIPELPQPLDIIYPTCLSCHHYVTVVNFLGWERVL